MIERVSTVDAVVQAITRLAYSGQLRAGAPLRESELADLFSVGRHSVRAALQVVARDGVAVYQPNRGVFLREFSAADIEDIHALRSALETEAVRVIHENRAPRDTVDAALERIAALDATDDIGDAILAELEVHRALVASTGSARMLDSFDAVMRELRLAVAQAGIEPKDPGTIHREQRRLIDELWDLSKAKAERRIREEIAESAAAIEAAMAKAA